MVYGFQQSLTSLYNNYCMHYIQDRTDPHKIFLDTYSLWVSEMHELLSTAFQKL